MSGSATAAVVAKSKYQAAMKAAAAQNVHYVSTATEQGISLEVVGDTGKSSGSQKLEVQNGSTTEDLSVVLIGKTGYLRGNVSALEKVLGLTTAQSDAYQNRWLSFPTSNHSLSELVSGLLDSEVSAELEMTGPYSFGGTKVIGGHVTDTAVARVATTGGRCDATATEVLVSPLPGTATAADVTPSVSVCRRGLIQLSSLFHNG